MKKIIITIVLVFIFSAICFAEKISISQIDSSSLLVTQDIRLYVSVTDDNGYPLGKLSKDMFKVSESIDNLFFKEAKIKNFQVSANELAGIKFYLMIDNSGSMYDTIDGLPTDKPEEMRITHARSAIKSFVTSMTNSRDSIGIGYFNTNYKQLEPLTKDKMKITLALDKITKPDETQSYTELYAGLSLAADVLRNETGRKVIIVLSDGENFPFYEHSKQEHPVYKTKIFEYTEPVASYQEDGISLFAVSFASSPDKNLDKMTTSTGGTLFNAANEKELTDVYRSIQQRILNEYLITYKANMQPADKKFVKAELTKEGNTISATAFYFASTIFGIPLKQISWLLIIPLLLAALLWFLLSRIKFIKLNQEANLEVLSSGPGTTLVNTIPLNKGNTVIGSSTEAALTITGIPAVKDNHATIVFDDKASKYTIVSEAEIMVNNNFVNKRVLESGDIINVGGATIVFDDQVFKTKTDVKKKDKK